MKAVGFKESLSVESPNALFEFEAEEPSVEPRDLLVEMKAISVNPVDVKVRALMPPENGNKILGYDAAGVVIEVGSEVQYFKIGDEVFYAGDITRPGTNAERHAVDERIVGRKPASISFANSAALPLTSITAWEILFDCFRVVEATGKGDSLLVIGGAGGVGSILIQLAKQLTRLTVIATASRQDTIDWVNKMGADHVINHRESLVEQCKKLGLQPRYVAALTGTEGHFPSIVELIKPRGHITMIDDPNSIDVSSIKPKALSLSWEFMFARSMFQTDDMDAQHHLLNRVSALVDGGQLISTATVDFGAMSAESLLKAHALQESGKAIGKTVVQGF